MKIVIAPDSFKGSLPAKGVAAAIEKGIKKAFPQAETLCLPIADGGEGTMDTLVAATGGKKKEVRVTGPLGDPIDAAYGILGDRKTCVIEMAAASGIDLVPKEKLNPMTATTYGTGELIKQALDDGLRSFILALGGSATNDGGAGMLQALGVRLKNEAGDEVAVGGEALAHVRNVDVDGFDSRIKDSDFLIASDVQSPLIGPYGASCVFGPQKGATPAQVAILDKSLENWADQVEHVTGIHLHDFPGAGAAGGIGGAFAAFFAAEMKRGIDVVIEKTELEKALLEADLLITGEGQADAQTAAGKTPMGAAQAALKQGVPSIIIAGSVGAGIEELYQFGVVSVHSIIQRPMTLEKAMQETEALLALTSEQVVRSYFHLSFNK
ncbi:glycerate kinase [Bacillus piscicola]|uniref:glycerate kinase n=1 Tax=Bacillus piscicola TaxID=1632684 RepID=UPI001F090369|nr:glycerate kinase [Bacillus piscicola]